MATSKRMHRTYACTFCGKDQNQVRRLIAGPGEVYICDECITKIGQKPEASNVISGAEGSDQERCSFCGKQPRAVKYVAQGPHGVRICNECIELCQQIIDEEQDVLRKATDAEHHTPQPRLQRRKQK